MTQVLQELVRGFRGENRLLPDDLLPDNVSPDAQNTDYSRGTLRKRKGYAKLHSEAILEGGVRIDNDANNKCVLIRDHSALDLVGDFTVELFIRMWSIGDSPTIRLLTKFHAASTSGWHLQVRGSTKEWRFIMPDSGGTNQIASISSSTVPLVYGATYHLIAMRDGTDLSLTVTNLNDGTTNTGTNTCSGETTNARDVYVGAEDGAAPTSTNQDCVFDELRIFDDVRTADELSEAQNRELNESELQDANLVGYWKFNDARWNIVEDVSVNKNHGHLFESGPSFVDGIVPNQGEEGFAIRGDGYDDVAETNYRSSYAPILDTGNTWTIEAWLRFDSGNVVGQERALQLGDLLAGNGSPFQIYTKSLSRDLYFSYSTTTTHSNVERDTGYECVVGQAFHFALVRDGDSIVAYVNGEVQDSITGVTTENGPTTSTAHGLKLLHREAGGDGNFGPFTIDEVRLWTTARSQTEIQEWMNHTYPHTKDSNLVAYLRFDAGDHLRDESEPDDDFDVKFTPLTDDAPVWTYGLVYPQSPPRMLLAVPYATPVRADLVRSGVNPFIREILVATHTDFWRVVGGEIQHLGRLDTPGATSLFDSCTWLDQVVVCNGVEPNKKYDGGERPHTVTIEDNENTLTATPAGAGGTWPRGDGAFEYRFSYRNDKDGTESLVGDATTATVTASTHDTVDLASIDDSDNPQVTHKRIYRKDPSSTVFRFLADVEQGTTTYQDVGTDVSNNEALNTLRGHVNPYRYCAVYNNRLFFANGDGNPSRIRFSEAGTADFPASNFIDIDEGDGDEMTGMIAAFGGLILFKQFSIFFLTGENVQTFQVRKALVGQGCIAAQTIAESPRGVYYLSHDGVYLLDNAFNTNFVSYSQQPEFIKRDPERQRFSVGAYDPETHQYIVSFSTVNEITPATASYSDINLGLFEAYYKFESDGTDETGNHNLSPGNNPDHIVDSVRDKVVSLNVSGITQEYYATNFSLSDDVTLGCWFKMEEPPSIGFTSMCAIGSVGNPIYIQTRKGEIEVNVVTTASSDAFVIPHDTTKWTHIIVSKQGASFLVFVDGEIRINVTLGGTAFALTPTILVVGRDIGITPSIWTGGYIDNLFLIDGTGITAGLAKKIYDQEQILTIAETNPITMAYDEESDSWAKWDKGFDTMLVGEHSENRAELIASRNCFVNRLLHMNTDGATLFAGSEVVATGSVTNLTGTTLEDTGASFLTENNDLAGVEVVVVSSADGTRQTRTILANTATKLFVDAPFIPSITGTYYVGPIDWYWESRWMDLGIPGFMKRFYRLLLNVKEDNASVTFKWKTERFETWQEKTLSTADETLQKIMNSRGKRLKIRFEHLLPNQQAEIESFQAMYAQRRWN